ncbi:hypothetical protein [Prosthecomicrobium sp. N25]|uniref:hypothetical protein n=1 Tax=Prosthecomicrobium sp. N25 TaxID=3129254 RepID=UPI003076A2FE
MLASLMKALVVLVFLLVSRAASAEELTGIWRGIMMTPWGQAMNIEVIFMPNAHYTSAASMNELMTRHWGHYSVGQNWIHFDLQGWNPTEYCVPAGCTRLAWPQSETWSIVYFDGQILRTPNGELHRAQ